VLACCFRLLKVDSKDEQLLADIKSENSQRRFLASSRFVEQLPGAPFAYWMNAGVARVFGSQSRFQSDDRWASAGVSTGDDQRFLRTWWEVPSRALFSYDNSNAPGKEDRWIGYAKGGEFSPMYDNIHLVLNWADDGLEMRAGVASGVLPGARIQGTSNFYRPGVTWPGFTTSRMSPRALPAGCGYAQVATTVFSRKNEELPLLLYMLSSDPVFYLMKLSMGLGDAGRKVYGVGNIQRLPFPDVLERFGGVLEPVSILKVAMSLALIDESDRHYLVTPPDPEAVAIQANLMHADTASQLRLINNVLGDCYKLSDNCLGEVVLELASDGESIECLFADYLRGRIDALGSDHVRFLSHAFGTVLWQVGSRHHIKDP
jgi:hypothetical protein